MFNIFMLICIEFCILEVVEVVVSGFFFRMVRWWLVERNVEFTALPNYEDPVHHHCQILEVESQIHKLLLLCFDFLALLYRHVQLLSHLVTTKHQVLALEQRDSHGHEHLM